jgi:hypothetical protein
MFGLEPLTHDLCPDPPGSPEFGNLLKEVDVGIEEKGKPGGKVVDVEASFDGRVNISDGIGQGEGEFLNCRGSLREYGIR